MPSFNNRFFSIIAFFSLPLYGSHAPHLPPSVPTTKINVTMSECLQNAELKYKKGEYTEAAMGASCFIAYANKRAKDNVQDTEMIRVHNFSELVNNAHYILAQSHLNNPRSQQLPKESFDKICGVKTSYGTLNPSAIAHGLSQKNNPSAACTELMHYYKYAFPYVHYNNALSSGLKPTTNYIKLIVDEQQDIRKMAVQLLDNSCISTKNIFQQLTACQENASFQSRVKDFMASDGAHIVPLLERELLKANKTLKSKIHYFLGNMHYYNQDYKQAYSHLKELTHNKSDASLEYKTLFALCNQEELSYVHACHIAEKIVSSLSSEIKSSKALLYINNKHEIIKEYALKCVAIFAQNNDYERIAIFANELASNAPFYSLAVNAVSLISLQNYPLIDEWPVYKNIVVHYQEHKDTQSLECLARTLINKSLNLKTVHPELTQKCLTLSSVQESYTQEELTTVKNNIGECFYTLSKKEENAEKKELYLQKAALSGHAVAVVNEATKFVSPNFLYKYCTSEEKMEYVKSIFEQVEKLTNDCHPTETRIAAFEAMAFLPLNVLFEKDKIIEIQEKTVASQCYYLQQAHDLGSLVMGRTLAYLHEQNTKDSSGKEKACTVLKKYITENPSPKAYYELAIIYFKRGAEYRQQAYTWFQVALDALPKDPSDALLAHDRLVAFFYKAFECLEKNTVESIAQAYIFSEKGRSFCGADSEDYLLCNFITEDLLNNIITHAKLCMDQKDTSVNALSICTLLGRIYYEVIELAEHTILGQQEEKLQNFKSMACKSLEYAADLRHIKAQCIVLLCNPPLIPTWKKVEYGFRILTQVTPAEWKSIGINPKELLEDICPKTTLEKYNCLQDLSKNRKRASLESYVCSPYFFNMERIDAETGNKEIAELFYNDTILKPYIDGLKRDYELDVATSMVNLNATTMYAHAIMYSQQLQALELSKEYLSKVRAYYKDQSQKTIDKLYEIVLKRISALTIAHNVLAKKGTTQPKARAQKTIINQKSISEALNKTIECALFEGTRLGGVRHGLLAECSYCVPTPAADNKYREIQQYKGDRKLNALVQLSDKNRHLVATTDVIELFYQKNNIEKTKEYIKRFLNYALIPKEPNSKAHIFRNNDCLVCFAEAIFPTVIQNQEIKKHIVQLFNHYQINADRFKNCIKEGIPVYKDIITQYWK